ncbi:MAG: hypothetical protein J5836_00710 [Clostridia bacterium]|nr:hypothetical protein [Clostridia bacterium]
MNPLLIILAVLLLGGERTKFIETIKNIDFNSFKPIFQLLGLNENFTEFICSENFSDFLDGGLDVKKLPELISSAKDIFAAGSFKEKAESADEKPIEYLGLEPIKDVAPSEIEENLGSFFA